MSDENSNLNDESYQFGNVVNYFHATFYARCPHCNTEDGYELKSNIEFINCRSIDCRKTFIINRKDIVCEFLKKIRKCMDTKSQWRDSLFVIFNWLQNIGYLNCFCINHVGNQWSINLSLNYSNSGEMRIETTMKEDLYETIKETIYLIEDYLKERTDLKNNDWKKIENQIDEENKS